MRIAKQAMVMLLLALLARTGVAADSFDAVRSAVRTEEPDEPAAAPAPQPETKKKKPPKYSWEESCEEEDDDDDSALVGIAVGGAMLVVSAPYWMPNILLEHEDAGPLLFASVPYESSKGWMKYPNYSDTPTDVFAWGSQIRAEYLDDYDGLTGYRARLLTEHVSRWGFDSETNYWQQSLSPGVHDELWTGDANIVYRFAQNERIQMRSGLGVAWLADSQEADFGLNFTYGGDIYPLDPLVISAELDAGWIGEAWMIHLRSTIGVVYKQAEVYTGYDYLEIGNAQLDGFIAGVKLYF